MLSLVENAATESYDDPTLRKLDPHERLVDARLTPARRDRRRRYDADGVDAPPEQEWLGLMMNEFNAWG